MDEQQLKLLSMKEQIEAVLLDCETEEDFQTMKAQLIEQLKQVK